MKKTTKKVEKSAPVQKEVMKEKGKKKSKTAPVKTETAKAIGKKKAKTAPAGLSAEAFLIKRFDEDTVMALKAMISRESQETDSYILKTIEEKINIGDSEKSVNRSYPFHGLDDDELEVGQNFIRKALKELGEDYKINAWATLIDGKEASPRGIYRKAFELAGYEVDWEYTSYQAMSWLEHHGFKSFRKA
jgi:hypothetical protein